MGKQYTATDGTLTLVLTVAEEGGFVVTSPMDPQLVTQGETLDEAFEMAYDALECLREARKMLLAKALQDGDLARELAQKSPSAPIKPTRSPGAKRKPTAPPPDMPSKAPTSK